MTQANKPSIKKSISIVIPAHNEERLLKGCLDAIAAQTVAPDLVIVVDNNSTDRTAKVASDYSFVTVVQESHQGIVYARNRGFDLSLAQNIDIIGRIDADTLLPVDWVETILAYYDDVAHGRSVINGGCWFYNLRSGNIIGWAYGLVVHRLNRFILGYYFPWGSNTALPAVLWREVRGMVCVRTDIHEDLDLGIHLHDSGATVEYWPGMKVGAVARRIMDERGKLWNYLQMWTRTMRLHDVKLWPLCVPFGAGIWLGSYGVFIIESIINRFGRKPAGLQ